MNRDKTKPTILLVGNPNIGKSVLFNSITGLGVTVSNYPGTTVDFTEGRSKFKKFDFRIVDLPGTYSLSANSADQAVSRNKILELRGASIIVNVIDASNLERNLILTIELLELEVPFIICLNMIDEAEKKGLKINYSKLEEIIGVPVVPTIAVRGQGIERLIKTAISALNGELCLKPMKVRLGRDIEKKISKLIKILDESAFSGILNLPGREISIKLLEKDPSTMEYLKQNYSDLLSESDKIAREIEEEHGESSAVRIAKERNAVATSIADAVKQVVKPKVNLKDKLDLITTQPLTGIPIMIGVLIGLFAVLVFGGGFLEQLFITAWDAAIKPLFTNLSNFIMNPAVNTIFLDGVSVGIQATLAIVLPYVAVFYVILGLLEDTGYLTRIAFLTDGVMHKLGLHGKSIIPLISGLGCSVPAIMSTRILVSRRERIIASFLITLIPCSARTSVILGVIASNIGLIPVLLVYIVIIGLVFIFGLALNRILKGEKTGLVMEMPAYRLPQLKNILRKTWLRIRDFATVALPFIIVGSVFLGALSYFGLLISLSNALYPITTIMLGLPAITGVVLFFGVLRKELAVIMLIQVLGTSNLLTVLTPVNLIVFTLVVSLYVPCLATFTAIGKELGLKYAIIIPVATIFIAFSVGGITNYILTSFI